MLKSKTVAEEKRKWWQLTLCHPWGSHLKLTDYADLGTSQSFLQQIKAQLGGFLRRSLKRSCGRLLSTIAAYRQFNREPLDRYHSHLHAEHLCCCFLSALRWKPFTRDTEGRPLWLTQHFHEECGYYINIIEYDILYEILIGPTLSDIYGNHQWVALLSCYGQFWK